MGLLDGVPNAGKQFSKDDLRSIQDEEARRQEAARLDPLNYGFPPHEGQLKIHRSHSKEILLISSNRYGKSVGSMREVLWRARGEHPYKEVRLHDMIWCGFPDYPFFKRVTIKLFRKWVPKAWLVSYDKQDKVATIRRVDGGTCEIHFISYDTGADKWQGASVDFIWLDEEVPRDIYEEASSRLVDVDGDMLITQTPVSGLGWIFDDIFLPAKEGRTDTEVIEGALAEYRPECVCGHNPEDHNKDGTCKVCPCRRMQEKYEMGIGRIIVPPTHPMGKREKLIRWARKFKDLDTRLIRVFGKFRGRAGGIYKQYSAAIHRIPAFPIPSYYEVWGGIDPGFHGFAVVLVAQDPMGRLFVFYEFFSQHETTGDRARELWSAVQERVPLGDEDYIPIYVDTEDPQTIMELNVWAQENGARLAFAPLKQGLKAKKAGIARVQEYLAPDRSRAKPSWVKRDTPPEGEPMIYFFDTLHSSWISGEDSVDTSRLLWEMARYLWQRKKAGASTDEPDKASAAGAHMCFVAGTLVTLERGAVPIEQVTVGDMALTRNGFRPVVASQETHRDAELWELRTEDGTVLVGTSDHPVYLVGFGYVPIVALDRGAELWSVYKGTLRTRSVRPLGERAAVYGLRVDNPGGTGEYFANGVLVKNCDALRYAMMARVSPPETPSEDPHEEGLSDMEIRIREDLEEADRKVRERDVA